MRVPTMVAVRSLTRLSVLAVLVASCATPSATPSPTATPAGTASPAARAITSPSATPTGLVSLPIVTFAMRHWWTLPDGLDPRGISVRALIAADDAQAGVPRARLRSTGTTVPLVHVGAKTDPSVATLPPAFDGTIPLDGAKAGPDVVQVLLRMRDGRDVVAAEAEVVVTAPEYVVWTLDFEGDAASDAALANTAAIADGMAVPMTIMWNSRAWTTAEVSASRAEAMVDWTKGRGAKGDEIALHVHAWTDFVRAAGVTPRTAPSWSGRSDGYDVPLTAFNEEETRQLIDRAVGLMTEHGFARPTSFRAGGLFANAANLRAIAAAGFTVDSSSAAAGAFGRLPLPWTLAADAQPYRPARDDANAAGDLPLLEVPNIAGNTYALTTATIQPTIRQDLAMLAPQGKAAMSTRALTLVSHPATIDATERAAIESLFRALAPYRYDADAGPLRFVTLRDLARAYAR